MVLYISQLDIHRPMRPGRMHPSTTTELANIQLLLSIIFRFPDDWEEVNIMPFLYRTRRKIEENTP